MSYFIDTHSHIFAEEFDSDRNEVILSATKNNVRKQIIPNIDIETIEPMLSICRQYPEVCFPAIGLHPSSVRPGFEKDLSIIKDYLKKLTFCAIGEVGIDLYWDTTWHDEQIEAFKIQIEISIEFDLPLIIHSRKSLDEIILLLERKYAGKAYGVFHCYPGNYKQAKKITDLGFCLGIGGVVTYKNSGLADVVRDIDLSHIILETDSPYLSPVPFRGTRNTSSNIIVIADAIASIKHISSDEVADVTSKTAINMFKI